MPVEIDIYRLVAVVYSPADAIDFIGKSNGSIFSSDETAEHTVGHRFHVHNYFTYNTVGEPTEINRIVLAVKTYCLFVDCQRLLYKLIRLQVGFFGEHI
ncbi:hypothetical protein Barb6_00462 [Bacteroidales bacterium Barb6]|nr:hypothetical protein Barb6_01032 [Bacteroidales bacterium Barb6]OAV73205.1 hypothetical protein Barb6_00462 [Bacteroidales bacterium Barb6]